MNIVEVEIFRHPIYSAYAADKFGDIYSLKFGKINMIRSRVSNGGYLRFNICLGSSRKTYLSHRFVFECVNNRLIEKISKLIILIMIRRIIISPIYAKLVSLQIV